MANFNLFHKASRFFRNNKDTSPLSDVPGTTQDIPKNGNPSPDTAGIPLPTSPPNGIPRNILAFRTITNLLSLIQQEQAFQVNWETSLADNQELALSTAFATIAVIDHEIVAVATKLTHEKIEVVCAPQTSIEDRSTQPSWPVRGSEFSVAKNFCQDDPPPILQTGPTISLADDAGILPGIDLDNDEILKTWVDERWSNTTIPVHLRVLGKLLSMKESSPNGPTKDPGKLAGRLLHYVIATCYPKITRRFKHKTLSQPYIRSLKQVNTFDVDNSKLGKPSPQRTGHDQLFLTKFFLTTSEKFQTKFPTLLKQAKMVRDKDFQLYTEDTCAEFHKLLIFLLVRFEEGLDKLGETRGDQMVPTPCSEEFQKSVEVVFTSGYALQRLAHGAALRMHLKTITPLLMRKFLSQTKMTMPAPGEAKEQEEVDEDLEAVQPFIKVNGVIQTHLWKSYIDWLQLIIVHFDAVEDLVRYFTGKDCPVKAISIHILAPPPVDKCLLPWRELLNDSTLFPTTTTLTRALSGCANITNAGILKFFNEALVSTSPAQASVVNMWWRKGDLGSTIDSLEKLKSSKLAGWKESAMRLLVTLKGLQDMPAQGGELEIQISDDIKTMAQSGNFFATLASNTPETDFRGTLHCEAFLASILGETANVSEGLVAQMKGMGSTIGISKCCCPACRHLLALLEQDRPQPFIVRGTHNTVTACTLPTWLPSHIVDSMNVFVGGLLRQEFIRLINRLHTRLTNDNNLPVSGVEVESDS